jgi:hypothetical protein
MAASFSVPTFMQIWASSAAARAAQARPQADGGTWQYPPERMHIVQTGYEKEDQVVQEAL